MTERFKVGDHVTWNSEAGYVSGTIIRVHTKDVDYKGHTRHASHDAPQYEIKSDKTDHILGRGHVARWSADPLGMLWPEMDAAFVTSAGNGIGPAGDRRKRSTVSTER